MNTDANSLINITIDQHSLSVVKGTTVYQAACKLGIEIPIFCYHDRMPPFGACRMCLVGVEKMEKLQTACTLLATDGMIVHTDNDLVRAQRKEILELLLINHPLDCPVCDRAGECPLQDNTMKYGPGMSRFFEQKRHFKKPLPMSSVLMLDRERCIACARCSRFSEHVAGDHALELLERGYKTEIGAAGGGAVESKFIGNTIMICPVGALTSRVYRFKARPWDNEVTKSSCTLCSVGCSMLFDARDGQIMRTRSSEQPSLNDIWLCDKGWFGYEFTEHPKRLSTPLLRIDGQLLAVSWEEALTYIAKKIEDVQSVGRLAAFGGNLLSTEENFLLQKLMRQVIGSNHIDHRIGEPLFSTTNNGQAECSTGMEITIGDCAKLSFVLILGVDLTEEFPIIWLRLREALHAGATVIFMGHFTPEISPYFTKTLVHRPGEELAMLKQELVKLDEVIKSNRASAIFVGKQYLNNGQRSAILDTLSQWRQKATSISINILEGRNNSRGAALAGMRPDCAPYGFPLHEKEGMNAQQVLEKAAQSGWDFLYVVGANPALKFPNRVWQEARDKLGCLVVQDLFLTATAAQADVVLPALCYVEKSGTFINIEGRLQKIAPAKNIPSQIYSDGDIFIRLAQKLQHKLAVDADFAQILTNSQFIYPTVSVVYPAHTEHTAIQSQLLAEHTEEELMGTFAQVLFDHGVRMQHNPHLMSLTKKPFVRCHPSEGEKRHISDGQKVRLSAHGAWINATLKYDTGVAAQTLVLPLGFANSLPLQNLEAYGWNGFRIKMERAENEQ